MAGQKSSKKTASKGGSAKAVIALVFGILSIPAAIIPLLGLPLGIVGLILSIIAKRASRQYAGAALVCSILGLVLTVVNGALGVYFAL